MSHLWDENRAWFCACGLVGSLTKMQDEYSTPPLKPTAPSIDCRHSIEERSLIEGNIDKNCAQIMRDLLKIGAFDEIVCLKIVRQREPYRKAVSVSVIRDNSPLHTSVEVKEAESWIDAMALAIEEVKRQRMQD